MTNCTSQFLAGKETGPGAENMRSNVTSEVSLTTHVNQWWSTIPLVTSCVIVVCVSVYVFDLVFGFDSFFLVCSCPHSFLTGYQLYRAFTSVVFHIGILHVGLNMMALYPISSPLERLMGSIRQAHAIFLFCITNALLATSIAYAVKLVTGYQGLVNECAIGFSGVIFSLIVLENHVSPGSTRSIFGFFSVPARWYPWVLLIIFQVILPSVSFLGHLSGLISGIAYQQGFFTYLTPSSGIVNSIERLSLLSAVVRRPGFISGGHDITGGGGGGGYGLPTISIPTPSRAGTQGMSNPFSSAWRSFQGTFAQLSNRGAQTQNQGVNSNSDSNSGVIQAAFPGGDPSGRSVLQSPAGEVPIPAGYPIPGFGLPTSAASSNSSASDPKFPGKGRTLAESDSSNGGGVPGSLSNTQNTVYVPTGQLPTNPVIAAAAAAALARAAGGRAANSIPRTQEQTWQAQAQAQAQGSVPQGVSQSRPEENMAGALEHLLVMGFQRDAAQTALEAANGDLFMALDILSTS